MQIIFIIKSLIIQIQLIYQLLEHKYSLKSFELLFSYFDSLYINFKVPKLDFFFQID